MVNLKKFSLLICFFLIVNQDTIGNKHFDERWDLGVPFQSESNKVDEVFKIQLSKTANFLNLPHTSIYLR